MDLKEIWQNVLAEIELQISKPNFLTWFKDSKLVEKKEKEGQVLIGFPNQFAKEWVKNRYHKLILGILRQIDSSIKNIEYTVLAETDDKKIILKKINHQKQNIIDIQPTLIESKIDPKTNLNSLYTFDNFVIGSSNELAVAAGQAIINDIGKKYNPFFVYGGVGLGKTHLIQAIGNKIIETYKNKINVLYITSEKFINDVVSALRNKRIEDIKQKYRKIDVLIIDDIQFIGGKPSTELEFFYTFNALYENQKQIIISSDRPPTAIPTLEERLKSRFEGGMITDISYPDYEMRLAILKNKIQQRNINLEEKILELIASKVQRNIRELEGALNKVIFYYQFKNGELDLKKVENIIEDYTKQSFKNITFNDIIKTVAEFYDINPSDIIKRSRKQDIIEPRQIVMYLLREILKMSFPTIGEKIGKRDHTTVLHAYEKISKEITENPNLNHKITLIKEKIYKNI